MTTDPITRRTEEQIAANNEAWQATQARRAAMLCLLHLFLIAVACGALLRLALLLF